MGTARCWYQQKSRDGVLVSKKKTVSLKIDNQRGQLLSLLFSCVCKAVHRYRFFLCIVSSAPICMVCAINIPAHPHQSPSLRVRLDHPARFTGSSAKGKTLWFKRMSTSNRGFHAPVQHSKHSVNAKFPVVSCQIRLYRP